MKIPRKKKKIFRRLARLHFLLTVIAFGFYLSLAFFLGPRFLLSDLQEKFHTFAAGIITVTARVLAPPVSPVVTATPICQTGIPRVNLDWADDDNTTAWSITRDGLPLVSGLALSGYADISVADVTGYSYVVTAHGPMGPGIAASATVNTTTLDCGALQPTPVLSVVSFQGMNVNLAGQLSTKVSRPTFTGTTNIPNAHIDILVNSTQIVSDQVIANATGYWEWMSAVDLETGDHTMTVTATDPLDGTRTVQSVTSFTIEAIPSESTNGGDHDGTDTKKKKPAVPPAVIVTPPTMTLPFDFTVQSSARSAYQGDLIGVAVRVSHVDPKLIGSNSIAIFDLIAPDGENKAHTESTLMLSTNARTESQLTLPLSLDPMDGYRIRITLILGKFIVTREEILSVRPLPILQLGGGTMVTLPQVVAFSGWIALALLTLLLLWMFLFLREYWLYLHALRHITERQLIRLGFFGMRKGVSG